MYFLRNIIFHFPSRKNITFSRKRNAIFPDDTRKIIFQCYFLERISFQNIWRKYISIIFFLGRSSFIFRRKNKIIFSGKEISSFLMAEEMYPSAICLERPFFQNNWKNKIWFFAQQIPPSRTRKIWIALNVGFFMNL